MFILRKLLDRYWFNWIFLFVVLFVYLIGFLVNPSWWFEVGKYFVTLFFKNILPVLVLVYFLIFIFNILIDKNFLKKFFESWSYSVKLFISIISGILSSWPIYLWYPLLKQLKHRGLTWWHIAAFIYARAIKIPLLPMMVGFFGWKYTLVFNIVILFLAFLIWIVVDILMEYSE